MGFLLNSSPLHSLVFTPNHTNLGLPAEWKIRVSLLERGFKTVFDFWVFPLCPALSIGGSVGKKRADLLARLRQV
jgi:hypothetical protein